MNRCLFRTESGCGVDRQVGELVLCVEAAIRAQLRTEGDVEVKMTDGWHRLMIVRFRDRASAELPTRRPHGCFDHGWRGSNGW